MRHTIGRIGFGATLLLLSVVLPALAAAPEETPVWIEVSLNSSGQPVASPEVAVLRVSKKEYAQWKAADGQDIDFEIVMRDGDDDERKLAKPNCERKGRCRSQVPTLKHLGRHGYDIIVKTATGTLVLDPEVEIER
jgi:hypothetical protein